jgi:glycosyltransferase involved in cell wall biosynthesis
MLKVLQLIPTLDRSGAEKQMALLAAGLPRDRFRVEVAALTRLGPLEGDLGAAGVPVAKVGKRFKLDPIAFGKLYGLLKRGKFDIIQTWIYAANSYGRAAARLAGVPVVVTAEMAVDLWKGPGSLALDRRLARWTDRVVGNSRAVVDFYRKAGIPEAKLEMIYSGIPEPAPAPDSRGTRLALGIAPEAPVALFAGRLAPQKGLIDLLNAVDVLLHVRPDLVTLIAGDGPQRWELEDLARRYRIDHAVRFLGHREDVPALMAACDLFVLPSLYEGLPNVVLEAQQAGKPVVATAAPGTTEAIRDGETGLLVPPSDQVALARAIRRVIEDRGLAASLGEAGRAAVARDFRASDMIDRFAALYERLAAEKGLIGRSEAGG